MKQGERQDGTRAVSGFFAATVGRPVALAVAFITLIVVGLISYSRIPLELLPSEFSGGSLGLYVVNPGSNARENEEQIAAFLSKHPEITRARHGNDRITASHGPLATIIIWVLDRASSRPRLFRLNRWQRLLLMADFYISQH